MNVNLTPNITGKNVNIIKGATQADLTNSVNNSKIYRDEAEAFSIVSEAKSIEASYSALNASINSTTASDKATIATTKANEANNSAINASASEAVCIAKATITTDKANIATAQSVIATDKANEASVSANTATTQAGIATTKASEASISASNALTSENNADTSEANALIYRNQAESFANSINPSDLVHISGTETITGNKTFSGTVSGLTKATVGLSNVDNTSDANKPISNAVQTALDLKADKATTLGGYGITDAYTKTSTDSLIDIHSKTEKTTLVDADEFMTADSTSSWSLKKITWASIKTLLANSFIPKVTSTDNAIVRFNGTTGDVQNSGVIIDDNNNVGVGIVNPIDGNIHIHTGANSNIKFTNSTTGTTASDGLFVGIDSAGDAYVFNKEAKTLSLGTNNLHRMIIDSTGNVGIGVTPSGWQLGVVTGVDVKDYYNYGASVVGGFGVNAYYNAGWKYKYSGAIPLNCEIGNGAFKWQTAPSGTAGNAIAFTNAMTLDASGYLTVGGNATMPVIASKYDGTNYIYMQGRNTSDTTEVLLNLIGGVKKSAILSNGTYQSATNSYGSTSDAKLKENVVETSDKLDKLMNVRVVNFNYIGDDQKQIGVIAQEVEKIFPAIVYETKDTKQVEVTKTKEVTDEEGNVTTKEYTETETVETCEVTKNVKYSVIYMMMLKGMQEQQAIINDLKTRIEVLESK